MDLKLLRESLAAAGDRVRKLADSFEANGRKWASPTDELEFEAAVVRFDELKASIDEETRGTGVAGHVSRINQTLTSIDRPGVIGGRAVGGKRATGSQPTGDTFQAADGRIVNAYRHGESFPAEATESDEQVSVGACVHALLTGDTDRLNRHEFKALTAGTDTAGGYTVSSTLSSQLIDLARSQMVCSRAGCQSISMDTAELRLVKLTGDISTTWRNEMSPLTASNPTFGQAILRPRVVGALVPISIELLEDGSNVQQMVQNSIAAALALAVDQAVLGANSIGTGANGQILGLLNNGDITTATVGPAALATNYDAVSDAVRLVMEANFPGDSSQLAWVLHPRLASVYDKLRDSQNNPLTASPWSGSVQRFTTTSLPLSSATHKPTSFLLGDFSQVVVAYRNNIRFELLSEGQATLPDTTTGNATTSLFKWIRAWLRVDTVCLRPTWMVAATNVYTE